MSEKIPTTASERRKFVEQANANSALEGLTPDAADLERQARFIKGEISSADMLNEVMAEARALKNEKLTLEERLELFNPEVHGGEWPNRRKLIG